MTEPTDQQLLKQFLGGDQFSALGQIFKRHGPLAKGVCLRVLENDHDADDALQAVFLVFASKASSIRQQQDLTSWFYGVALRCARQLKRKLAIRRKQEAEIHEEIMRAQSNSEDGWETIRPVLDKELGALAEKYQVPLVHCYIEGLSYEETAHKMGLDFEALKMRLARGRDLLRKRLLRRGMTVSSVTLGGMILQNASSSAYAFSDAAIQSTVQAVMASGILAGSATPVAAGTISTTATEIMKGVLQTMFYKKALIIGLALAIGGGLTATTLPVLQSHDLQLAQASVPAQPGEKSTDPAPRANAGWYAGPEGKPTNDGSLNAPWDLTSALDGSKPIAPGETLWILKGTYRYPDRSESSKGYEIRLAGTEKKPIKIRAREGERVTIDGGLSVVPPSDYLWIQDLEIIHSETLAGARKTTPSSGLYITAGTGCKYINLVLHDTPAGCHFMQGATESELYGCLIYNNGWDKTDGRHSNCIYTQNEEGTKRISNCILTCPPEGKTHVVQAYAQSGFINNYLVEDNIAYGAGRLLLGGNKPVSNLRVLRNYCYKVPLQAGYGIPGNENEDCEIRDNVVFKSTLTIKPFKKVINEGNLVVPENAPEKPRDPRSVLLPNQYDPRRAHLAIFNWDGKEGSSMDISVKAAPFLKDGDTFRLLDPKDFYGRPLFEGKCAGETIQVPVKGEFEVFVVLKN